MGSCIHAVATAVEGDEAPCGVLCIFLREGGG